MAKFRFIGVLALILAFAGVAIAQETTSGSITGTVRDSQGASVPGATVTVTSEQGSKTLVSDSQGRFFAPFLTPGLYGVKVELTGFSPVERKAIQVRLGQRVDLEFTLKVGDFQEVVEVVGAAPVVDTSSTTAGGVLDTDTLKKLPVGRNFTDTLYLVPGVSDSSGVGKSNPSIAGASGLDNNYVVDGVNISNTGFGGVGSYSIVFGSLGTGVTTDFIKETQVKTGGFEAEYGQSTGGVVNVVTQSGTNTFHGALYGYFRPYGLTSDYKQLVTPQGTVNTTGDENIDFGVSLSGPLVKDKVFFFGAFNPQYQNRKFHAPTNTNADGSPQFPLTSLGDVERKRKIYSYAGKLTYQLNANHRFDATFFGDPSKGDEGPQRFTSLRSQDQSSFSTLDTYGGHNQSVRYDGILSPSWLIEASFAHSTNTVNEIPAVDAWRVTDRTVVPTLTTGGIGFYDKGGTGTNKQYSLKSTNIFDAGGNHQVRYGVLFEDITFARDSSRTGPTFTLPDGTKTRTGASISILPDPVIGRFWRVTRANFGPVPETTQKYWSVFAQDTWQIGKRLTFRPGVRWERQHLVGGGLKGCQAGESSTGANDSGGEPIFCEVTFTDNYSPRIGATYDIFGNGKSKIYASWGRFFTKVPNDLAARALSADAGTSRADYFDAGLTRPIPQGQNVGGTTNHYIPLGAAVAVFAPDAKSTYKQEFLGGVEFEVARSVSLGVRYVHRSIPRVLEDYGQNSVAYTVENSFGDYFIDNISPSLTTFDLPGFSSKFEDPVHKYDAVEVTLNKNFSDNWGLVTSYRWSRLKGNFEGFYRADNGQSDPSITSLFDFPTNDPSYTSFGAPVLGFRGDIRYLGDSLGSGSLPNDRTHQFKIYGTYTFGSLNMGVGLNAGSGKVLTALAANPAYDNSGEIPLTLRGGGINTVSGVPGCDQCGGARTKSPFETTLDMHVDYTLKFGNQRLILLADVFNLFNRQAPLDFDNYVETAFTVDNPNYGYPTNGGGSSAAGYQVPRQIRLGARIEW